jgi:hypothetical protein
LGDAKKNISEEIAQITGLDEDTFQVLVMPGTSLLSPATLNDHEGVTLREHQFVNVLSPSSSSVAP